MDDAPTFLSLGAGVQSTTLLLAAIDGLIPPIDRAIFADTGAEPKAVYDHLQRLTDHAADHGIPVDIVRNGSIVEPRGFASIPFYVEGAEGQGIGRRQCTSEYKLTPIKRHVRRLLGAPVGDDGRVGRLPRGRYATVMVGISTDEIGRVKPSDVAYMRRIDPLVDLLIWNRQDCHDYLADRWPHPVARSACIICPFRADLEWRALTDDELEQAFDYDDRLRAADSPVHKSGLRAKAFLHASRIPLRDVTFDDTPPSGSEAPSLFGPQNACSPFGCDSTLHRGAD